MKNQLIEILGLPAGTSEETILATVTAWAGERKTATQSAAFEKRIADMCRATNMIREMAVQTLAAQDAGK